MCMYIHVLHKYVYIVYVYTETNIYIIHVCAKFIRICIHIYMHTCINTAQANAKGPGYAEQ